MFSAFNTSRNTADSRSVTFTVPRDMLSISETSKIEQAKLTLTSGVYDKIRADFVANSLLLTPWSSHSGAVGGVFQMGGSAGQTYVANNWSTYETTFDNSLTLTSFTGTYSKTSTNHQFTVTMSNPTIWVIAITE